MSRIGEVAPGTAGAGCQTAPAQSTFGLAELVRSSATSVRAAPVDVQASASPVAGPEPAVPDAGHVTRTLGGRGGGVVSGLGEAEGDGLGLGEGDGLALGIGLGLGKDDDTAAAIGGDDRDDTPAEPAAQPSARSATATSAAIRDDRLPATRMRRCLRWPHPWTTSSAGYAGIAYDADPSLLAEGPGPPGVVVVGER